MARIFITGSSDGLGQLAARWLVARGHQVVLHARNERRARDAQAGVPEADAVLIGDLGDLDATQRLADAANASGPFDAVIHNAGVYQAPTRDILYVNTLAPYVLTCLIDPPQRLVYLSSGLHRSGRPALTRMTEQGGVGYGDSKLHVVMLAKAAARRWPGVYANAVDPGWVPTKMGGAGAPDDLAKGAETQAWLAVSDDPGAAVSGRYFFHKAETPCHPDANDAALQDALLAACEALTGVAFPAS